MRKLVVRTAQWLLENPLEQPGWVVEDLVPCGLTLIAGDPKIGKSWFGLDLALCVASGEPFWGFATAKGTVLSISVLKIPSIASRDACRDLWTRPTTTCATSSLHSASETA